MVLNGDMILYYESINIINISNRMHIRHKISKFNQSISSNKIFYEECNVLYKINTYNSKSLTKTNLLKINLIILEH